MRDTSSPLDSVDRPPTVWLLMGHKVGDNAQMLALAEGLGWPHEIKRFVYRRYEIVPNLLLGATLAGVERQRSSTLAPPWPDLVISAGRRNEPIARWIRRQAPERVRILHFGRPWGPLGSFDLIVTTPQYRLPDLANILHVETPLHRVNPQRLSREAAQWESRLRHLPRPFTAVLVGGSSPPYVFDERTAERLAREVSAFAAGQGGSLLISTSARTPLPAIDVMQANLSVPAELFRWSKDAPDNPYIAFLGLAEAIIVTGESMSMLSEGCATGKPVHIFDIGEGRTAMRRRPDAIEPVLQSGQGSALNPGALVQRVVRAVGPERFQRDIRVIQNNLVDAGYAVWLGDAFPAERQRPPLDCLARTVVRVREMVRSETIITVGARAAGGGSNA